jgi:hypothetical protein
MAKRGSDHWYDSTLTLGVPFPHPCGGRALLPVVEALTVSADVSE